MKKILFLILMLIIPLSVNAENLRIKKLVVDEKIIDLKENLYEYNTTINNYINTADILIELDEGIEYQIEGNENLVVGNNVIKINISNGTTTKEYILNILKMADEVVTLSSNNKLKNLSISGYPLGFDADKLEYNLTIKAESKLNINYEAYSDLAEVYIDGNEKLVNGSIIKIKVIAQSGDIREYRINITATEVREEIEIEDKDKVDMKLIAYIVSAALISMFLVIINVTGKEKNESIKEKK